MEEVWGIYPNWFQWNIMSTISQMLSNDFSPNVLLLSQPIGNVKYTVLQKESVIANGVSIIIKPTLSLSLDQVSKCYADSKKHGGLMHYYQLYLCKKHNDREGISNDVLSVMRQKKNQDTQLNISSFFLFPSPELFVLPPWMTFADQLIKLEILNLTCIDEVHSFK